MKRKWLYTIAGLFGLMALGFYASIFWSDPDLKSFGKVRQEHKSSELFLLDHQGRPLHQWRQSKNERVFSWVPLTEMSPALVPAILKSEDKNFYLHIGIDFPALAASFYQRAFKRSSRGGSTITMQLVKLISPRRSQYDGLIGKLRQILAAQALERAWSKDQILEAYLNLVSYRGEFRGISSTSWNLFNKNPSGLTQTESVLLSVLIRSPNAKPDQWADRACRQEPQDCRSMTAMIKELNSESRKAFSPQTALHLAQRLSQLGRVGEVKTTIRKDLQEYTQEVVRSHIATLALRNVKDAAVLVIENKTGEVWAYVGGADPESLNYVDGIRSFRQAGSTLKPFLYATAFEKGILTADSWIEDSAVDIVFERGVYKPQNHDRKFHGWVKARMALGSSLNVPAVKVFKLLNDQSFWEKLHAMNFRNLQEPLHYGPALALGVADITLEDLTQGYRTLAQEGRYSPLKFISEVSDSVELLPEEQLVFTSESAQITSKILADNENRVLGFGLDSTLSLPGASVKTGTSKDMRDSWCVGFNDRFTVGVWVGNFSGEPMWNVMSIVGAVPIWRSVMERLESTYSQASPLSLIQESSVAEPSIDLPSQKPQAYPQAQIIYPQDGMVLALDPAIPKAYQKIPLIIEALEKKNYSWRINGKKKVSAIREYLWTPEVGTHTFQLYHGSQLKDTVQVLVR